jgi:hypothetical protein
LGDATAQESITNAFANIYSTKTITLRHSQGQQPVEEHRITKSHPHTSGAAKNK